MTLSINDITIVDSDHSLNNLTNIDATSTTTIRSAIENKPKVHFDTLANRNAYASAGALVFTTDTNDLYIFDSTEAIWVEIGGS